MGQPAGNAEGLHSLWAVSVHPLGFPLARSSAPMPPAGSLSGAWEGFAVGLNGDPHCVIFLMFSQGQHSPIHTTLRHGAVLGEMHQEPLSKVRAIRANESQGPVGVAQCLSIDL